ncbi:hypothetical protein BDV95DRAFT_589702 [Massariosphaeria phaeospora]|uniref:Uncharacterized protein n=1 Tax=Massariosphaeria phaeospora TaxID=100035 RepID=A0A7C8MX38_9PLEO|nr:hypothetical protein BDV95DRAFT_589702 [Massariosphaeria phaeospora]
MDLAHLTLPSSPRTVDPIDNVTEPAQLTPPSSPRTVYPADTVTEPKTMTFGAIRQVLASWDFRAEYKTQSSETVKAIAEQLFEHLPPHLDQEQLLHIVHAEVHLRLFQCLTSFGYNTFELSTDDTGNVLIACRAYGFHSTLLHDWVVSDYVVLRNPLDITLDFEHDFISRRQDSDVCISTGDRVRVLNGIFGTATVFLVDSNGVYCLTAGHVVDDCPRQDVEIVHGMDGTVVKATHLPNRARGVTIGLLRR